MERGSRDEEEMGRWRKASLLLFASLMIRNVLVYLGEELKMRYRFAWFVTAIILGLVEGTCCAQEQERRESFPQGIILIGVQKLDDRDACSIEVISPTGKAIGTLFRRETGSILAGGRLSRQGDRLAVCFLPKDGQPEVLVVDCHGQTKKIMDGDATITAWSPDGRQIAGYRKDPQTGAWENFIIDLATLERRKLELGADYVAEDWHPSQDVRTAIFMNPRNQMYREKNGDSYPARQLDLLTDDGNKSPITKNPSTDNIWSKFSPNGDRLAHYGRRLIGEKSLEYAVICGADGSHPREVFNFTEYGDKTGLNWFRPNGPPAWSPDSSSLVWRISTNSEPTSADERHELLFMAADGGNPRRLPLADMGIQWASGTHWH